jgi:hypothetical protein
MDNTKVAMKCKGNQFIGRVWYDSHVGATEGLLHFMEGD